MNRDGSEHITNVLRKKLIGDGTRKFIQEAQRTENYNLLDLIHGYIYGRWPYLYIGIGIGEHPLASTAQRVADFVQRLLPWRNKPDRKPGSVAESYHGKVIPIDVARQLVAVNQDLRVPDLEQVIPYSKARALILNNPEHIIALDCPCRSSRSDPCLPLDVCLIIGEPFAGFVHEHQPEKSRWISASEAETILLEEHKRGHAHHAFFKDAMLNRFYAICNCCSCCCGAMQAMRNGSPMLASSGFVSVVNPDDCIGCGDCVEICPFAVIELMDEAVRIDREQCMGCGICIDECSQAALSLELAPDRGIPFEIGTLMQMAAESTQMASPQSKPVL
jgi:NAD-dependent dihydropyrimidine dehydrogenase PreA subunit